MGWLMIENWKWYITSGLIGLVVCNDKKYEEMNNEWLAKNNINVEITGSKSIFD